jgi:DNA repair photolyase
MKQDKAVFGTKEWASSTINIQIGCEHGCKYCYAKTKHVEFGRSLAYDWEKPVIKPRLPGIGKRTGIIMFPSTHDITPDNITQVSVVLLRMLEKENDVLLVSKPHLECIKEICRIAEPYKKKQLLFRFTIGSANNEVLKFWEPQAPAFDERLASLKYAFEKGFKTSVSSEPMLDEEIHKLVEAVEPFVTDSIWIGKMNFAEERVRKNGFTDDLTIGKVRSLMAFQSIDENIWNIYYKFRRHPKIKWKESIKKVLGIVVPTEAGLDI